MSDLEKLARELMSQSNQLNDTGHKVWCMANDWHGGKPCNCGADRKRAEAAEKENERLLALLKESVAQELPRLEEVQLHVKLAAAEAHVKELEAHNQQLTGEPFSERNHGALRARLKELERDNKALEMIVRERVFWTANDPSFDRQGYSCFIDECALRDINYRDAELHPTIEQAIAAAKEYMIAAMNPQEKGQ